jgi:hypothetical protein
LQEFSKKHTHTQRVKIKVTAAATNGSLLNIQSSQSGFDLPSFSPGKNNRLVSL